MRDDLRSVSPTRPTRPRARASAGFALFSAIWLAALVSLIAVSISRENRIAVAIADNEIDAARLAAAAGAGVQMMAAKLAALHRGVPLAPLGDAPGPRDGLAGDVWIAVDGRAYGWTFAGVRLSVSAEAEAGKLDLNRADPGDLARLFASLGLAAPEALAQAIALHRASAGGLSWRMDAKPFEEVADLAALPGVERTVYAAAAPFLTVHADSRRPDPIVASEAAFRHMPLSDEERRSAARQRARMAGEDCADPAPCLPAPGVYTVRAAASTKAGRAVSAAALIEIVEDEPGSRILRWLVN